LHHGDVADQGLIYEVDGELALKHWSGAFLSKFNFKVLVIVFMIVFVPKR
jgi:hypothetical protein